MLDFKQELALQDIPRHVPVFANTRGGVIVVGIAEDRGRASEISAMAAKSEIERQIRDNLDGNIDPPVTDICIRRIDCPGVEDASVVTVGVPKSGRLHMTGHRYYCRRGAASVPMTEQDVREAYARLLRCGTRRNSPQIAPPLGDEEDACAGQGVAADEVALSIP